MRRSRVFENLFSLPRTGIREDEGRSDESPIVLQGHSSADFDCLLDYLFGRYIIAVHHDQLHH